MQNLSIWLKLHCFPPNVGGSERSRLWCVSTWIPGKQRHSKCSNWPPSVWTHTSSLFRQWSIASTSCCCNSSYCGLVLDTHAPASCLRCSKLPDLDQDCWLATCQDWWTGVSRSARTRLYRECDMLVHCFAEITQIIRCTY